MTTLSSFCGHDHPSIISQPSSTAGDCLQSNFDICFFQLPAYFDLWLTLRDHGTIPDSFCTEPFILLATEFLTLKQTRVDLCSPSLEEVGLNVYNYHVFCPILVKHYFKNKLN